MKFTAHSTLIPILLLVGCSPRASNPLPPLNWHDLKNVVVDPGERVDKNAESDLSVLLRKEHNRPSLPEEEREETTIDMLALPYCEFAKAHPGTRACSRAVLYLSFKLMILEEWTKPALERLSNSNGLTWERLVATRKLAESRFWWYERSRDNLAADKYERYWEDMRSWLENNIELDRKLDAYLKSDKDFREFKKYIWSGIHSFEISNYVGRANSYYVRKQYDKCKAVLSDIAERFKDHPKMPHYEKFIARWFKFKRDD